MKKNRRTKRRAFEASRITSNIATITDLLEDKEYLNSYGHYQKVNNSFILPKPQDVVYETRGDLEVEKLILAQKSYLKDNVGKKLLPKGESVYFLIPLSSMIPLPSPYMANRGVGYSNRGIGHMLSTTLLNAIKNAGDDKNGNAIYHGASFALLGFHSNNKIQGKDLQNIYEELVMYLNDFITAYKLFRHDHTVHNVTTRTLPSTIAFYRQNKKGRISDEQLMTVHGNDLMDIWEKRLPEDPETFEAEFMELCELLAFDRLTQYVLRIGERSVTDYCLGKYEDCVVNSDRFAELALRDILRRELNLSNDELKAYKSIYSTSGSNKAVVQTLASHFNCKGDSVIVKWFELSRKVRNGIVHGLDIVSIDAEAAQDALRFNLLIVDMMAEKSKHSFGWYRLLQKNFSELFAGERE